MEGSVNEINGTQKCTYRTNAGVCYDFDVCRGEKTRLSNNLYTHRSFGYFLTTSGAKVPAT